LCPAQLGSGRAEKKKKTGAALKTSQLSRKQKTGAAHHRNRGAATAKQKKHFSLLSAEGFWHTQPPFSCLVISPAPPPCPFVSLAHIHNLGSVLWLVRLLLFASRALR
jgi:hypothetical protein